MRVSWIALLLVALLTGSALASEKEILEQKLRDQENRINALESERALEDFKKRVEELDSGKQQKELQKTMQEHRQMMEEHGRREREERRERDFQGWVDMMEKQQPGFKEKK